MDKNQKIKCSISGALTGFVNGFFGGGGGMLLVPLLLRFVKLEEKQAFPTSLAITMPLSIASSLVYLTRVELNYNILLLFLIGGIPGSIAAGLLMKKMPVKLLRRLLGIMVAVSGIRFFL